jgi:peroxiredoxin
MRHLFLIGLLVFAGMLSAQEFQLGSKVSDFSIRDVAGNPMSFHSLQGDVTVVTFIATQCPVSNAYNGRMNALYKDYAGRGVKFVFINPNATEPAAEVAGHAQANFSFAVYKDSDNVVADRFGAQVTPEAFVIDRTGTIRYHGSIDDSQNEGRIQVRGLRQALDAVLAGKSVETAQTKAFGCTIKKARKTT